MGDAGQVTWIIFWHWWAVAAVLLVFEMMLPGVVFLFLAIGAAASGLFLMVVPGLGLELQLLVFAIVSVLSAVVLRPTLKRLQHGRGVDENLNARGNALVGRTIVLDAPILRGQGRVKLGDGSWSVTGPDMVAGSRVRVTAVNGTELTVEPAP
jgi:membrane protein implicated in regulation of membrane protease activity